MLIFYAINKQDLIGFRKDFTDSLIKGFVEIQSSNDDFVCSECKKLTRKNIGYLKIFLKYLSLIVKAKMVADVHILFTLNN